MNKLKMIGIIVVFIPFNSLYSQPDTLFLTLKDARDYALSHNKQLLNAKKDIVITEAQYKETRARGLPQIQGGMDYMTNFNYEVEFSFGNGGDEPPDINYNVLDEGDEEILRFLSEVMTPTGPSTITMEDQLNAQFQVSQLIFSGQFWVGLEIAEIARAISQKQVEKTSIDVKEQVTNTYYLTLVSEETLNILTQNLANLKETLNHTQNMYKTGLVEKSDVDQIRMNVSQLQNTLEATRRNVKLSYNMLRIQLGLEKQREIRLKEGLGSLLDLTEHNLIEEPLDPEANLSYQLMDYQEKMQEEQVDLEKWSYAPTVSGFYSYTEKIMTTEFDLSPKNAAGLTLSLPIYSGGLRKARIDKAEVELDKTRRNKSLLEDQLNLQENQLKYDLRSAMDNYLTQKENVKVAKSVYNSYYNKYKQGLLSSLDLTQANNNYLQAENNYLSSVLKLLQARLALQKLYNTL
jgi:outer membrane protein TolC